MKNWHFIAIPIAIDILSSFYCCFIAILLPSIYWCKAIVLPCQCHFKLNVFSLQNHVKAIRLFIFEICLVILLSFTDILQSQKPFLQRFSPFSHRLSTPFAPLLPQGYEPLRKATRPRRQAMSSGGCTTTSTTTQVSNHHFILTDSAVALRWLWWMTTAGRQAATDNPNTLVGCFIPDDGKENKNGCKQFFQFFPSVCSRRNHGDRKRSKLLN